MQPNRLALRKVALSVLFICSLVAIMVMGSRAQADGETSEDAAIAKLQAIELEAEVQRDADALEQRDNKIDLYVNYVELTTVSTSCEDGDVYVPVVFFSEAMVDCKVSFNSGKLEIRADGLEIDAVVGDSYICANGRYIFVDGSVTLREDGHIWLPLTTMAKIFGCEYSYDSESRSAYLKTTGSFIVSGDTYYNEKDVYWLSRIINAESRGEPFIGQIAVGTVVMNRVASYRYPNTIYDVIFDGRQFTPAISGTVHREPTAQCVIVAKIILEGYRLSDHILYFHMITPAYYTDFENNEKEMVIGNHIFYTVYGTR